MGNLIVPFGRGPAGSLGTPTTKVKDNPSSLITPAGHSIKEVSVENPNVHIPMSAVSAEGPTIPVTAHSTAKSRPLPLPVHTQSFKLEPPNPIPSERNKSSVRTPIQIQKLSEYLTGYLHKTYLIKGFSEGFKLGYLGPRLPSSCSNLKSCSDFPDIICDKLQEEIQEKRLKGPFCMRPFPSLQISPIGLVPKKSGDFRLIHHLSHPKGKSVNDFLDPKMKTVKYASFDDAVNLLLQCGKGSFFAKTDIKNAFRLIPIHPSDYDL
jgi:hypothetical protein